MNRSTQALFCVSLALLGVALPARRALAQSTPAAPAATSEATVDHERSCRDEWFVSWRCRDRRWDGPELMLGVDLGVSVMNEGGPFGFNQGVGAVTDAGPAWGLRVGVELFPWLALEAHYVGMYNSAQASVSPMGSVGILTTGGDAVVRLTAPLPYVHPYIFGGVGYYANAVVGPVGALAASQLFSSYEPGLPLGFGLDVPVSWHLSLGIEATYHHLQGEIFSSNTTNGIDGGDLSTVNIVARFRL
jgi:hypothetical protein